PAALRPLARLQRCLLGIGNCVPTCPRPEDHGDWTLGHPDTGFRDRGHWRVAVGGHRAPRLRRGGRPGRLQRPGRKCAVVSACRGRAGRPAWEGRMTATCPECGAPLPDGMSCIDRFHALLLLESEVAAAPAESSGGRGEFAHFYAVGSYVLQHPTSMSYTAEALAGLRQNVSDHLAGRVTLAELRHRVRRAANGATRVTRGAGDEAVRWPVQSWPLTVADVIAGGVEDYGRRV